MNKQLLTAIISTLVGAILMMFLTLNQCNKPEHLDYVKPPPKSSLLYLSITCSNGYVLNMPLSIEQKDYIASNNLRLDIVRMEFRARE